MLRGAKLETLTVDGLTFVVWKHGNWYYALTGQLAPGDRDIFVDLVRQAQDA
ncbi:MAG: hypothetical protein ACK4N5_24750 [Myxococcales bacterium]